MALPVTDFLTWVTDKALPALLVHPLVDFLAIGVATCALCLLVRLLRGR